MILNKKYCTWEEGGPHKKVSKDENEKKQDLTKISRTLMVLTKI